jgi:hypothetical protein
MTNELATRGPVSLASLPEHLRAVAGVRDGKENVGMEDLLIPRLCVCNSLSPQRQKAHESYIKGLEEGNLFNSLTGQNYGDRVKVIPLFFFKNYIKFKDIKDGGGVLAQYAGRDEVPDEELSWNNPTGKPLTTEFKNRMCMIDVGEGNWQPIVVSFKSTGMKDAKKWNSLINMIPLPAYAREYALVSSARSKNNNNYFGIAVQPDAFVSKEVLDSAKALFDSLQSRGFKVDDSGLDRDEAAGDASFDEKDM